MGIFNERIWRVERHGRQVPVVMQHNVTAARFDVTVGGFSVPMRATQTPEGATILSFAVRGQAAGIIVSAGAEGTTYDLQLGEELPPPERTPAPARSPAMLGTAPVSMPPTAPERVSMPPRPVMHAAPPASKSSTSLIIVLSVIGFMLAAGVAFAFSRKAVSSFVVSLISPKITWKAYAPPGGRFSIELPENVKEETQTQQTPAGSLTIHNYSADAKTRAFSVGYFDLPFNVPPDRIDAVLEGGRDGSLKQIKGTLIHSQRTEYLGYPAIEYSADIPQGTTLQRAYLIGSRMYYLVVAGVKPLKEEEADQFFSSFKLTRL